MVRFRPRFVKDRNFGRKSVQSSGRDELDCDALITTGNLSKAEIFVTILVPIHDEDVDEIGTLPEVARDEMIEVQLSPSVEKVKAIIISLIRLLKDLSDLEYSVLNKNKVQNQMKLRFYPAKSCQIIDIRIMIILWTSNS